MNYILWQRIKEIGDTIYACTALFVVPGIIVAPLGWLMETPPSMRSSLQSRPSMAVPGVQELSGRLDFDGKPMRVSYNLEIVGDGGRVFSFPQVNTRQAPQFDNVIIPVPKSIAPGTYRLVAKVRYAVNPITSVYREVPVTSITVD